MTLNSVYENSNKNDTKNYMFETWPKTHTKKYVYLLKNFFPSYKHLIRIYTTICYLSKDNLLYNNFDYMELNGNHEPHKA